MYKKRPDYDCAIIGLLTVSGVEYGNLGYPMTCIIVKERSPFTRRDGWQKICQKKKDRNSLLLSKKAIMKWK